MLVDQLMAVELRRVASQTKTDSSNQRDAFECLAARYGVRLTFLYSFEMFIPLLIMA